MQCGLLRAGDLSWPEAVGASPLLPWSMQRELGMPGTDAAQDGEQARRVTERIAGSAETVVFSYARESGKGQQRPSSSLAGLELEEVGIERGVEELVAAASAERVVGTGRDGGRDQNCSAAGCGDARWSCGAAVAGGLRVSERLRRCGCGRRRD